MTQVSFVVTGTTGVIVNQDYGLSAGGGISVMGTNSVMTLIDLDQKVHLPLLFKGN